MGRTKSTDSQLRRRVADRIRGARLARGWSQARLSEEIDVSVESISRYETGRLALSLELLSRMAQVLEISVATLVGEGPAGLTADEAELIEAWRMFGERGRQAILEVVRWGRESLDGH